MYEAHCRRENMAEVQSTRLAMIAGAWANTNFDSPENDRNAWLEEIDRVTTETIDGVYGGRAETEEEIPWEDPLFGTLKETVYSEPLTEDEIRRATIRSVRLNVDQVE